MKKKSTVRKIFGYILWGILAMIVLGTFVFLYKKSKPKPIVYEIVTPFKATIENKTVATGKVSPRDEVLIKPQISGIVSEIFKKAGEHIKSGEIIATIKVIPDMNTLNAAESRLRMAEINLAQVKLAYDRQVKLFEGGVISKDDMEKAEADYKKTREEAETAKDNLDIVREGMSQKTKQYSNTQIRSTINGMILDVPIKVGNSVIQTNNFNEGTTIASIANMNDMIFIGNVDETEVGRIHEKMPIILMIGALQNLKFDAILEYISPKGVEVNGAVQFEIKAAARIPDSVFVRAGYSANANIVLARADSVLSLPEGCVTFENDSTFVHILKKNGSENQEFERKFVETGLSDGINIEIKSGLNPEEEVRGSQKMDKR